MFPIICTAKIHSEVLSAILTSAYTSPDCQPSLVVLFDPSLLDSPSFGSEPTAPPVPEFATYPFLSKSISELAAFLQDNGRVSDRIFLIMDERTAQDRSVLLAVRQIGGEVQTVRLAQEYSNSQPIALEIGSMGIQEIIALADSDGVFRGGRKVGVVKKGGEAPAKKLGG